MLGNFLEISIHTPDILASLDFYRRLGFERAPVNDVWTHPYAVVSDGHIYLGLHQYAFPSPALTFVLPDLRRQIADFEALGIQFEFCKLGDDSFNEAGFYDPDRQMVTLLEARSCSPLDSHITDCVCGYFDEFRLQVHDPQVTRKFWEKIGLIYIGPDTLQGHAVRIATGGLNLGLQKSAGFGRQSLVFLHARPEALAEQLLQRNISITAASASQDTGLCLTAPEGTRLLVERDDS